METGFIATISNHRVLGHIILPYTVIQQKDKVFYTVKDRLTVNSLEGYNESLPAGIKELVNIVDKYDENEIVKLFSRNTKKINKKKSSSDFFSTISDEDIQDKIRPYVENRLLKAIDIIKENNIPFYFKDQAHNIHIEDKIEIVKEPAESVFNFHRFEEGIKYHLSIKNGDSNIELTDKSGFVLVNTPGRLILENKLFMFNDIDGKKLLPFFTKKHVLVPKSAEKSYFEKFITNTIKKYRVEAKGFNLNIINEEPVPVLSLENTLEGKPVLILCFHYKFKSVFLANRATEPKVLLKDENNNYEFFKIVRHTTRENEVIDFLKQLGLKNKKGPEFYPATSEYDHYDLVGFIIDKKNAINNEGIKIDQHFFQDRYSFDEVKLDFNVQKENDWFDVHAMVYIGDERIPFSRLRRNILKNIREYELSNGKIAILPEEWFEKYRDLFLFGDKGEESIKLKKHHASLLEGHLEKPDKKIGKNLESLILTDNKDRLLIPVGVNATLRPYQLTGFNYMLQTTDNKLGVCLADDMGLGKTLQTLSVLQYRISNKENIVEKVIKKEGPQQLSLFADEEVSRIKEKQASLIVMPSSLIHNWNNEIKKFTPNLNVCLYTGVGREKNPDNFGNYDLVLTTYGTMRVDIEILKQYRFFYVILDESQVIKNQHSKAYKSAISLKSKYKLVLTGTPIENSLSDLWSQLNFLNNGLLGNYNFFKEEFLVPIEKHNDDQKQKKLKQIIQPFILRRTKQEVAKDLPELNEQTIFCDLTEEQEKFYESEKSKIRNHILQNIESNGIEKSAFVVLQGITRLRQLANHPFLVDDKYRHSSGKFEEVIRNIDNLAIENHKALIFSSFVKHLALVEGYLKEKGYGYAKLTGETKNREEEVKKFQENANHKFFLISLKAGGVGLNLTAAEYVFLLDPWWNPAAENQAINRAHRIGQENKVFVYRFISSTTIEEKIQNLQQRKSQLAEVFVNSNNPFKEMSVDNVMELFR